MRSQPKNPARVIKHLASYLRLITTPKSSPARAESGDTIVEVLISIAVVSSVLAGAFAVSNRSTINILDSQEHAEALQHLQGQVELLRTAVTTGEDALVNSIVTNNNHFCLEASGSTVVVHEMTTLPWPSSSTDTYSQYPNECERKDGIYHMAINRITPPVDSGLYNLTIRWPSTRGSPNEIQLRYRVHKIEKIVMLPLGDIQAAHDRWLRPLA
jgi:hypothetical protein